MPTFRLDPVNHRTGDPRWTATSLRETCWVEAVSETAARRLLALTTRRGQRLPHGTELRSPWVDPWLTDCHLQKPRPALLDFANAITSSLQRAWSDRGTVLRTARPPERAKPRPR